MNPRRRQASPTLLLGSALIVLLLLVGAFGFWAMSRIGELSKAQVRSQCDARLLGDFAIGVAHGFNSPPAPNRLRDQVAAEIQTAGERLGNADDICKAGVPPPLTTVPFTTSTTTTP